MPILDKSKMTQEKLEFMDRFLDERAEYPPEFLARQENQKLLITVEDNGIGIEPNQITTIGQNTPGFGLFNIRERLNHLGGKMNIQSLPEKGIKITLLAPLKTNMNAS